jgi:hypothetical protein
MLLLCRFVSTINACVFCKLNVMFTAAMDGRLSWLLHSTGIPLQ